MDAKTLEQSLTEEILRNWSILPTGSGFLITTDRHWPDKELIEIYVRTVGDREDLYVVSDGGNLFNRLFEQGINLTKDDQGMRVLNRVAEDYGAKFVDYQMVKGANEGDLAEAIRRMIEAVKDASFLLWHKIECRQADCVH